MTPFETVSIVLGLTTLTFAVIGWLLNKVIDQHKALNTAKAETTDTKFDGLINRLDDLVTQIGHLFRDQEIVTESVKGVSDRVGGLELDQGTRNTRCAEREKAIEDKFKVLHNRIDGIERDSRVGGKRTYDQPTDRIDREN